MTLFRNKFRIESARLQGYDYRHPGYYFVIICTKNRICFFGDIYDHQMHLSRCGDFANHYWIEIPQHCPMVKLDEFVIMPNHVHGIIRILDPNGDNARFPYPFLPYEFMPGNVVDAIPVETLRCNVSTGTASTTTGALSTTTGTTTGATGTDHWVADIPIGQNTILANNFYETNPNCESGSIHFSEALFVLPEFPDDPDYESIIEKELSWMMGSLAKMPKNKFMSDISPKKGSLSAIIRSYKSAVSRDSHKIDNKFDWHIRFHDRIVRNPVELFRIRNYIRKNPERWNNDRFIL